VDLASITGKQAVVERDPWRERRHSTLGQNALPVITRHLGERIDVVGGGMEVGRT
jgi:hypothetical protein